MTSPWQCKGKLDGKSYPNPNPNPRIKGITYGSFLTYLFGSASFYDWQEYGWFQWNVIGGDQVNGISFTEANHKSEQLSQLSI